MKKNLLLYLVIIITLPVFGQAPVITGVERIVSIPSGKVVITGTGFNSDPNQLSVWFGSEEGTVVSSTANLIEVQVPYGAHADNITVINKATKLSGKSILKHYTSFSGEPFDPSKVGTALKFPEANEMQDLCSCDLNRDGLVDIAATKFDATSNSVRILLNNSTVGNVAFNNGPSVTLNAQTNDIQCGDLNGDGWPDLVATKGGGSGIDRNAIYIIPNNGGTISGTSTLLLTAGTVTTEQIKIRDLNFDGKPELIVSNSKTNSLFIFRNTSGASISFDLTPIELVVDGIESSRGLEVQDLNRDGRPEIIITAKIGTQETVEVLVNTSTQDRLGFSDPLIFSVGTLLKDIITGDFNRDGLLDIAVSSSPVTDKVFVLINTSTIGATAGTSVINFASPQGFTVASAWGLDVGDVDGDGWLDIMVGSRNQQAFHIVNNQSTDGNFNMNVDRVDVDNLTRFVSLNDYDNDGKPDFSYTSIVPSNGGFNVEILRNENCYSPVIISESPRKICAGQTFTVFAVPSPGTTFTWYLDNAIIKTGTDNFVDIISAGSLEVVASSGSCSLASNVVVWEDGTGTIPTDPTAGNDGPVCVGETLQLSSSNVAGATYSWIGPDGFTSSQQNPQILDVQPENAGEYILTISLGDCQSSEVSTIVEVFAFPTLFIESSTGDGFCAGSPSQLSVPNIAGLSYEWFETGNNTPLSSVSTLDITVGGEYYVVATNIALGCSYSVEPVNIVSTAPPVLTLSAPKTTICVGEDLVITADITTEAGFTPTFNWDFGDGSTSTEANPTYQWAAANSYTVSLVVGYEEVDNCTDTETISITVSDAVAPVITSDLPALCPDEQATLSIAGTYTSITWVSGATGPSIVVDGPGTYTAETLDANSCPGNASIDIIAKNVPDVWVFEPGIVVKDTLIQPGASIQLIAGGADTYSWDNTSNTLDDPLISNPTAIPNSSTSYTVTGTLTGECSADAIINVSLGVGPPDVDAANAFSPNGDAIDDQWVIQRIENYSQCTITIFDRRGRVIYESAGYNNDWDGTYNGSMLPVGTYFWSLTCPSEDLTPLKGTILLVR